MWYYIRGLFFFGDLNFVYVVLVFYDYLNGVRYYVLCKKYRLILYCRKKTCFINKYM